MARRSRPDNKQGSRRSSLWRVDQGWRLREQTQGEGWDDMNHGDMVTIYGVVATKPGRGMVEEYFDDIERARRCKRNHELLNYEAFIYEYEVRQHKASILSLLNRRGCLLFKGVVE